MEQNTESILKYYLNLIILQYKEKPRAQALIRAALTPLLIGENQKQLLKADRVAVRGGFTLNLEGFRSYNLIYNVDAGQVQAIINREFKINNVVVTGTVNDGMLIEYKDRSPLEPRITVTNVPPILASDVNLVPIVYTLENLDEPLPLKLDEAFSIQKAAGAQLSIIAKLFGLTRTFSSTDGKVITLSDADLRALILFARLKNIAGPTFSKIKNLFWDNFKDKVQVNDFQNFHASYLIDAALAGSDLLQAIIVQEVLPRPMAVQISIGRKTELKNKYFGFKSYVDQTQKTFGFNSYGDYKQDVKWLVYNDIIN